MEPEVLGVEHLKKALKLGFDFSEQAAVSGADGWGWTDGLSFLDEAMQIPGVIKDGNVIKAELLDLSEAEKDELKTWAAEEFDIPNDNAEGWVEDLLTWTFTTLALINRHRAKKA